MLRMEARWEVAGVTIECRDVRSQKNKDWRGYFAKIATKGMVAEVELNEQLFPKVQEGGTVVLRGFFKNGERGIKLIADQVVDASTGEEVSR